MGLRRRDHAVDGRRPAAPQRARRSAGCDRRGSSSRPWRERAGGRRRDQAGDEEGRPRDDHHRGLLRKGRQGSESFWAGGVAEADQAGGNAGSALVPAHLTLHCASPSTRSAAALLVTRFAKSILDISTIALVRLSTLSLRRISETWTFTVVSEILSS